MTVAETKIQWQLVPPFGIKKYFRPGRPEWRINAVAVCISHNSLGIVIKSIGAHTLEINNIGNAKIRIGQWQMIIGAPFIHIAKVGHFIAPGKRKTIGITVLVKRIPCLESEVE